jgi:hypothetical protein
MTEGTFNIGIDMLIAATRPYRWTADSKNAYWKVFHKVDDQVFIDTCHRLVSKTKEMPSIPELSSEIGPQKSSYASCDKCDNGRIHFTLRHRKRKLDYDMKYAACDCEAGDAVADQMVSMAKMAARANGRHPRFTNPAEFRFTAAQDRLKGVMIVTEPDTTNAPRVPIRATPRRVREPVAAKEAFDSLMGGTQ